MAVGKSNSKFKGNLSKAAERPKPKVAPVVPSAELHAPPEGIRSWFEALVMAFVLAMFVRTFLFELFKVPTGSMTPTIIGGRIIETDYDGDGKQDLLVWQVKNQWLKFLSKDGRLTDSGIEELDPIMINKFNLSGEIKDEHHRIFVSKFTYWFRDIQRGEIAVFKVPDPIWNPAKPFYVKRIVGLPNESVSWDADGRLLIEGKKPEQENPVFEHLRYKNFSGLQGLHQSDYVKYGNIDSGQIEIKEVSIPADHLYALGDNTSSSLDSRYWGAFGQERLKGKAFFRYWPLRKMSFLR